MGTFPSVSSHSLSICEAHPSAAAVFEFTILRDGKLGGVGGGDAISDLHAVPFLHLGQRAHQSGVGRIQRHDPFFLQHTKWGFILAPCGQLCRNALPNDCSNAFYQTAVHKMLPRQMERLCLFLRPSRASFPWAQWVCVSFSLFSICYSSPLGALRHHIKVTPCVIQTMRQRRQAALLY